MADWLKIQGFASRMEAEIARALLEAHGVEAIIQADDAGGMRPDLGFSQGASLLVKAQDRIAALRTLQPQAEPDSDPEGETPV